MFNKVNYWYIYGNYCIYVFFGLKIGNEYLVCKFFLMDFWNIIISIYNFRNINNDNG